MRIARFLAQLIDIATCIAILVISSLNVPSVLVRLGTGPAVNGTLAFIIAILVMFGIQYPFLAVGQTIGKAFFGLVVVTDDPNRPLSLPIILHRELSCKLASCFIICFPVMFGKPGGHEVATKTHVQWKRRK